MFLIRLLDIVNERGDVKLTGASCSCLALLRSIVDAPSFPSDPGVRILRDSVHEFEQWLAEKRPATLWLPTLNIEAQIQPSRLTFLEIAANQSKHNLSRLTAISRSIQSMLHEHGYDVPLGSVPLALDDFREHLHENYFAYYGTWLGQLINDICWGIYEYLRPVFQASYRAPPPGEIPYSYAYPMGINDEGAQEWFWRLMNDVRSPPPHRRFRANRYFTEQSSLEHKSGAGT